MRGDGRDHEGVDLGEEKKGGIMRLFVKEEKGGIMRVLTGEWRREEGS